MASSQTKLQAAWSPNSSRYESRFHVSLLPRGRSALTRLFIAILAGRPATHVGANSSAAAAQLHSRATTPERMVILRQVSLKPYASGVSNRSVEKLKPFDGEMASLHVVRGIVRTRASEVSCCMVMSIRAALSRSWILSSKFLLCSWTLKV